MILKNDIRESVAIQKSRTVGSRDIGHFRTISAHFFGGVFLLSSSRCTILRPDCFAPTAT